MNSLQIASLIFLVVLVVLVIRGTWGHRKRYNDDGDNWQNDSDSGSGGPSD